MRNLAERACFFLCLTLGRLLRSARYSKTRTVYKDGDPSTGSGSSRAWSRDERQVRKRRSFYAPLLIWLGGPLATLLDTGVRVLPQRDWEDRERRIYRSLYGTAIRVDEDGTLVLPCLPGETLASLLDDPGLEESIRKTVIERAVVALTEFHRSGLTHGDAMAENVMVDVEAGVARWFDFETVHESGRAMDWRRADDVRALLVTCVVRTGPRQLAETLQLVLDVYADEAVTRLLATSFTSVFRRALIFHLAQAGLSFQRFREIARLLCSRFGE